MLCNNNTVNPGFCNAQNLAFVISSYRLSHPNTKVAGNDAHGGNSGVYRDAHFLPHFQMDFISYFSGNTARPVRCGCKLLLPSGNLPSVYLQVVWLIPEVTTAMYSPGQLVTAVLNVGFDLMMLLSAVTKLKHSDLILKAERLPVKQSTRLLRLPTT